MSPSWRSITWPAVASARHVGVKGTRRLARVDRLDHLALARRRPAQRQHLDALARAIAAGTAPIVPISLDHRVIGTQRWAAVATTSKTIASTTRARCAHRLVAARQRCDEVAFTGSSIRTLTGCDAYAREP